MDIQAIARAIAKLQAKQDRQRAALATTEAELDLYRTELDRRQSKSTK